MGESTLESLAIEVAGSIRSTRVIALLSKLIRNHRARRYLRSDNGPEVIAAAVLRLGQPGGPRARTSSQEALAVRSIESFNVASE